MEIAEKVPKFLQRNKITLHTKNQNESSKISKIFVIQYTYIVKLLLCDSNHSFIVNQEIFDEH